MKTEDIYGQALALLISAEMHALGFSRHTGISCPPACGDCCHSDKPEDSVLSALPASLWAVDNGKLELLERYALEHPDKPCVFYDPALERPCSIYPLRPLICRLFGFAGRRDKYGMIQYLPCSRMLHKPRLRDATPPVFSDYSIRLANLYPPLGTDRRQLNAAFFKAAQWLLLRRQYEPENPWDGNPPFHNNISCNDSLPKAA